MWRLILTALIIALTIVGGYVMIKEPKAVLETSKVEIENIGGTLLKSSVFNPNSTHPVGIEEFNGTWELYNDIDSYFIDQTTGIQFTNHYLEHWTNNVFCGGRDTGSTILYFCNDATSFTWTYSTDNSTFAEVTGYKQIQWAGKRLDIYLQYYLGVNDSNMTLNMTMENVGNGDINDDLWFKWRMQDIKINYTYDDNKYYINETWYNANETLNLNYNSLPETKFFAEHEPSGEHLYYTWNGSLVYNLSVENETGEINAPVELELKVGTLQSGELFNTIMKWRDAPQAELEDDSMHANDTNITEGDIITITVPFSNSKRNSANWESVHLTETFNGAIGTSFPTGESGFKVTNIDVSGCTDADISCGDNGDGSVQINGTGIFSAQNITWTLESGSNSSYWDEYIIGDTCGLDTECSGAFVLNDQVTITVNSLPTDSCTCPSVDNNWEINMSDYCVISTDCNLSTGYLNYTGTGNCTFNATITSTGMGKPPSSSTLFLTSKGRVDLL